MGTGAGYHLSHLRRTGPMRLVLLSGWFSVPTAERAFLTRTALISKRNSESSYNKKQVHVCSPSDFRNRFKWRLFTLQEAATREAVTETQVCRSVGILQASGCSPWNACPVHIGGGASGEALALLEMRLGFQLFHTLFLLCFLPPPLPPAPSDREIYKS